VSRHVYYYVLVIEIDYLDIVGDMCQQTYAPLEIAFISVYKVIENLYYVEDFIDFDSYFNNKQIPDFSSLKNIIDCDDVVEQLQTACRNSFLNNNNNNNESNHSSDSNVKESQDVHDELVHIFGLQVLFIILIICVSSCLLCTCLWKAKRDRDLEIQMNELAYVYLEKA